MKALWCVSFQVDTLSLSKWTLSFVLSGHCVCFRTQIHRFVDFQPELKWNYQYVYVLFRSLIFLRVVFALLFEPLPIPHNNSITASCCLCLIIASWILVKQLLHKHAFPSCFPNNLKGSRICIMIVLRAVRCFTKRVECPWQIILHPDCWFV